MTEPKKPPVTTEILDAVCETLGIYERTDAKTADYHYDWFTSPLSKSKDSLTSTAQRPILKALSAILKATPEAKIKDGVRLAPELPCFFRVSDGVPLGIEARYISPPFKVETKDYQAVGLDLVAFLPKDASLDPAKKKPTRLRARARIARVVTGKEIARLEDPVELGVELRLAEKPAPGETPGAPPLLAALALNVGFKSDAEIRVDLTDASYLTAGTTSALRSVTWKRGESPVLPLVHTALLVVRAWVVWLCAKNPRPASPGTPHFAWRLRDHLFPLLEGTKTSTGAIEIPAFPLAACRPDPALLKPWLTGFLTPAAIISVLYHLRALLTGKEELGTAPGSAIAWFGERTDPADYSRPNDKDFGLVVRNLGDVTRGSLMLGLRGQHSWTSGTTRIGLVLEGDLVRASWEGMLAVGISGVSASAKTSVQTGRAALFLVVESTAANTPLCSTTSLGTIARLEFGAEFSLAGVHAEVRATATLAGITTVHSLAQAAADEIAALKAKLQEVINAVTAISDDIRAAALAIFNEAANIKPLLSRLIAEARAQAAGAATLDLGFATLDLAANVSAGTYSATLTPTLSVDLPLRLATGTAITISDTGVALTTGLELATPVSDALPWTPAVVCSLANGAAKFAVQLREPGKPPIEFSLLGGPAPTAELVGRLVRPLLDLATRDFTLDGLGVAEILDILGVKATGQTWTAPDPVAVARAFLPRLTSAAGALAQDTASALGLTFDPKNLTIAAQQLALGDGDVSTKIGKLGVTLLNAQGAIDPTLFVSDVELTARGPDGAPLFDADVVSVGNLKAKTSFDLYAPKLRSVELAVNDIRLPLGQSGNGDGGLLSTGKDNPGLNLELGWYAVGSVPAGASAGFYARFPGKAPSLSLAIDRVIGPVDVKRLNAALLDKVPKTSVPDLEITLDAEFKLGGVRIAPQGLGVRVPLERLGEPKFWTSRLAGLALAYRSEGVAIAGMLAKTDTGGFDGMATVEAFGFQLGALAAYSKIAPDGVASLAIFGVLRATLGGPPFFVVTGVAAGFGVNRGFERPKRLVDLRSNPLLATMQGAAIGIKEFREGLPERVGAYWLAAGVKFVSYGFITGDALLYVLFDNGFELGLLALASLKIPALAEVNLAIEAGFTTRGEPTLYARAALYDSWLLHKDCKLTGGFALQVWPNLGDAVITLGGYHPAFVRPANYPEVERIGFRWALGDAISVKGNCYFAMTPREAMGGGRLEVEGRWGPVAAGFHASVDGLIRWDPFWFDVQIEVGIWAAIDTWLGTLRLSLGVGLHVWGPPVGGVATIDIAVISIDIPFGSDQAPNKAPLPVARVLAEHLKIDLPPNTALTAGAVTWPAQNLLAAGATAPLRLVVASGRVGGATTTTLRLEPEFVLRLETALPLTELVVNGATTTLSTPGAAPIYLTLAEKTLSGSRLTIKTPWNRGSVVADAPRERPLALFGDIHASAGSSSTMARPLLMAVLWDMSATFFGSLVVDKLAPEYALRDEWCPLPLASSASGALASYTPAGAVAGAKWTLDELQVVAPTLAAQLRASGRPLPRRAATLAAVIEVQRAQLYRGKIAHHKRRALAPHAIERPPQLLELAYLTLPPAPATLWSRTTVTDELANLPRIAPPTSSPRSPLLAGVELHVVTPRTLAPRAAPATALPSDLRTRQGKHPRTVRAPEGPARRTHLLLDPAAFRQPEAVKAKTGRPFATLHTGEVCVLDLSRPDALQTLAWRFSSAGDQHLRVVALDPLGHPLADLHLAPGLQDMSLPSGSRRLALFGLGADAPTAQGREQRVLAVIKGAVTPSMPIAGFAATTPLVSVGARTLLGPGCVVRILEGTSSSRTPLGIGAASALLESATQVSIRFATAVDGVLGVHLHGLLGEKALSELAHITGDRRHQPEAARVRGAEVTLGFACEADADTHTLVLPRGLRFLGVSRWPGRQALPPERPIHHPVRSHSAATRFTVEVSK